MTFLTQMISRPCQASGPKVVGLTWFSHGMLPSQASAFYCLRLRSTPLFQIRHQQFSKATKSRLGFMEKLVESLLEIAQASGCSDLAECRKVVQAAAEQHRSLIFSILDLKLVDKTAFLQGVSKWLEIPWWDEPITSVAGPLREKIPAKTALRYHVVPCA
jgi:hypothetical protein